MHTQYTSLLSFFTQDNALPVAVMWIKANHPENIGHDHDYTELVVITGGNLKHLVEDESCTVQKGDVLLIPPGVPHCYTDTAGAGVLNLIFNSFKLPLPQLDIGEFPIFGKIFSRSDEKYVSAKPLLRLNNNELANVIGLISRIDDEVKSSRPGVMFSTLAVLMELLIFLCRTDSLQNPGEKTRFLIGDALNYMNTHFTEQVSLEKLSKISCMSLRSFQRHFFSTMGCPPTAYLLKIRLRSVQEMLISSDMEITTIALKCGFYDSNYLCKKFKKVFGMTPTEFRAMHSR